MSPAKQIRPVGMSVRQSKTSLAGFLVVILFMQTTAFSQSPALAAQYRDDRILVQPKRGVSPASLADFHTLQNSQVLHTYHGIGGLQVVHVATDQTVQTLIDAYNRSGLVEFAEPDYLIHASAIPNDPKYLDGTLWGLNNVGQNGGMADADIDGPEGWDVLASAGDIVVAVLDTGVRHTHEDLAANMWINPIDGGHGFNAFTGTNNPTDGNGHGTLVAGVLGAVGNNGKGVVGVSWRVQIMACKCLDDSGNGSDSTLIACIDYARTNGATIINASLDSPGMSLAVSNAIAVARDNGIIVVASCGNNSANVDVNPRYPACYDLDNIVSVAYTTRNDILASLSNYGATNVDLAAPGEQIHTTWSPTDNFYTSLFSGTSLAAPYVSGALALMQARYPSENYQQIISRVLKATDPLPTLSGKCVTGGRLNLRKALSPPIHLTAVSTLDAGPIELYLLTGPNRTCVIEASTNLMGWFPVFTNTTSADGTFDFIDDASTNSVRRYYRATSSP